MPSIRNIAVALPIKDGHVLVQTGYDGLKQQRFYRALGGGIEFGELAAVALRREFHEELGVELDHVELLNVIENIFIYEGTSGHEIAHVFTAESSAFDGMSTDVTLPIQDEPNSSAQWIPVASLRGGEDPLYPEGAGELLRQLAQNTPAVRELSSTEISTEAFRKLLWFASEVDDAKLLRILNEEIPHLTVAGVVDDDVVGFVAYRRTGDRVVVEYIAVGEDHRGVELGTSLISHITAQCPSVPVYAETDDDAVDFYRALGFEIAPGDRDLRWPDRQRYKCTLIQSRGAVPMAAIIRLAIGADIERLTRLKIEWSQLPTAPDPEQVSALAAEVTSWIADTETCVCAVAEVGEELVGMAWLVLHPRVPNIDDLHRRTGDIQSVFVQPIHRRQGLGRRLIEKLVNEAEHRSISTLTVSANSAALRLYENLGFRPSDLQLTRHRRG